MNKDEIIVMMIALMFVAVIWCSFVSYDMGYKKGIQYQKEQPVNIVVVGYSVDTPVTTFNATMQPGEQYVQVLAYTESMKNLKINNYRMWIVP